MSFIESKNGINDKTILSAMLRNNNKLQEDVQNFDNRLLEEARKFGIDVEALKDNLKRTTTERIQRLQIVFDSVQELQKAKML